MKSLINNKCLIADISLLLVAFIWGGGFIAAKMALSSVPPFYVLTFRFLCSGILITAIFSTKMKNLNRKTISAGIILGIFLYVGQAFQVIGLKYTTPGKQAFLVASYTIFVPFISWIFTKKKPTINSILAGFLTLIGIGLLSLQNNLSLDYGSILTLPFPLIFATQLVFIGIYVKNIDPLQLTAVQLITAGILSLLSALLLEPTVVFMSKDSIVGLSYLIIVNTTIAFLVQNIAQKYTSDSHASILISLEAVFGCFLSAILLGEVFTRKMILGCIIIFIAVILSKITISPYKLKKLNSK